MAATVCASLVFRLFGGPAITIEQGNRWWDVRNSFQTISKHFESPEANFKSMKSTGPLKDGKEPSHINKLGSSKTASTAT